MIVADGSALVVGVTDIGPRGLGVRERMATELIAAPHLVDAELGQGLRGLVLRGQMSAEKAWMAWRDAVDVVGQRFSHDLLATRAWDLRDNVNFYDGLYVSLAELLDSTLLTADRKLAQATGPRCQIDLI